MKKSNPRKILAFTSGRSDYDLLSYLYKMLSQDKGIDFRLIVSNAHLIFSSCAAGAHFSRVVCASSGDFELGNSGLVLFCDFERSKSAGGPISRAQFAREVEILTCLTPPLPAHPPHSPHFPPSPESSARSPSSAI